MNSALSGEKTRWVIAAALAGLILSVLMLLFRGPAGTMALPPVAAPMPPATAPARPRPVVQLAKSGTADAVLAEELVLGDMRPLFLPTEGLSVTLPEPRREPGKTFLDNETLKLTFGEADLNLDRGLPPVATINGQPAQSAAALDALATEGAAGPLAGFGRDPRAAGGALPARGGFVAVVSVATGHQVWAESLPAEARPAGSKPWQPVEFVASVDAAGLTAPLVVTTSSEVEEVDAHYRNFLARGYRIGDRLPPGFYRITVGP